MVTVNYRLGPLGFLAMGTEAVPGNAGLRDQSMALTWVRENIANFGGDPDSVTLFGESAGSLSVAFHLLSPLSKGLFHRAILQSGTAIAPSWGKLSPEYALMYSDMFSKALSCDQDEETLLCLQDQDILDILALTDMTDGSINDAWQPVPDIGFISDPFLPGDPEKLMESGQFNTEVEVILGTNLDEGIFMLLNVLFDPSLWEGFRNNFDIYGPKSLFNIGIAADITDEDVNKAHRIAEYYIGSIDNINEEHKQGMFDMYTDSLFLYGTHKTINYLTKHGVTVYQYILAYEGHYSFTQFYGIDSNGVCHADDLFYLWEPLFGLDDLSFSKDEELVRDVMTSSWTNFAIYGDPTPPGSGLSWTPLSPDLLCNYWNISGPNPIMATSQEIMDRMSMWDHVMMG